MIKMKLKIDTSVAWDELLLTFKHWLHSPNFHRAQTACSLDGLPTNFSRREHCARAHTARSAVCGGRGPASHGICRFSFDIAYYLLT